jgi:hypothetical protein
LSGNPEEPNQILSNSSEKPKKKIKRGESPKVKTVGNVLSSGK